MAEVHLPEPGRPYVLIEPAGERDIADADVSVLAHLYKTHGALLLRGFGTDVPQFRNFARGFCPTYVVNESRGRIPIEPENNIHTVDPGIGPFALHSELSREPWRPDAAFFGCLTAPSRGGATTVCDGVELARALPEEVRRGLMGRRLLHVKPTWPELLEFWLGSREPSDEVLANPPSWCPYKFGRTEDGIVRSFSRPALQRPMFVDSPAFANFLLFARFNHNRRDYPLLDDGQPVPERWLQAIKATGDKLTAEVNWQPGDVLMLDNTRFMHGRTAIQDPSQRFIATFFGYLGFAVPDSEEPPNAPWRKADFCPPAPHNRPMPSVATVEQSLMRAAQAQQQGRWSDAVREAEAALALRPDHPIAHNILGAGALARDDLAGAQRHFEAAAAADPKTPVFWLNLARVHERAGNDDAERKAIESALSIDQRNLMALIRLAQLHERRGEMGPAANRWAAVATLSAEHVSPSTELRAIFDHARAFVMRRSEELSDAVAAELKPDFEAASPRDRRRASTAMEVMLGRRQVYVNHCFGMHYPFLPADEFFDRENFPWLGELEAQTDAIRAEVVDLMKSCDSGMSPYIAMPPGTPRNIWSELNNNPAWSTLHLWRDGVRVEDACAKAPKTAAIVDRLPLAGIPGRAPNVFFSILQAGKHIPPHTGVTNTRTIIHLPLVVPPGCTFRVGGETREWIEGSAFAFDDTIEHEAWNRSGLDRAVLILDCWNPHLSEHERAMICRLFEVSDAQKSA